MTANIPFIMEGEGNALLVSISRRR